MPKLERILAITAAVEAAGILYGALGAFLTPTGSHEHDVLLALVLLGIAAPLAWHAARQSPRAASPSDPLTLRVTLPNVVLLVLCFSGALDSGLRSNDLLPALVASIALTVIGVATHCNRGRRLETQTL